MDAIAPTYPQLRDTIGTRIDAASPLRLAFERLNWQGRSERAIARRAALARMLEHAPGRTEHLSRDLWQRREKYRRCWGLARTAGQDWDEHGSVRGDYLTTEVCDYIPPSESRTAPYHDSGRAGLGLIRVHRKRVYAKSSKWYPRTTDSVFLVGRNEAGTFFAHAVARDCGTVREAISWIWAGREGSIVARQGDIALLAGAGPKYPTNMPRGHEIRSDGIYHATHPTIPLPAAGQRIIIARRATARASDETRD